jgi:low density lipoprotein receptor-related protein 5/6
VLLANAGVKYPFGLAIHNFSLYFTHVYKDHNTLKTVSTSGGQASVAHIQVFPRVRDRRGGLVMYNNTRNKGSNYCSVSNGGCWNDQLCLPELLGNRCVCLYGIPDETRQICTVPSSFLLFAEGTKIHGVIPTSTPNYSPDVFPPIDTGGMPIALSCDPHIQRLYWADTTDQAIWYVSLKQGKWEARHLLLGNLSDVKDVDVDWMSGNVYYADAGKSHIGVVTSSSDYRAIVVSLSVEKPVSLSLDVKKGMMYWIEAGFNTRIEVADMSGSHSSRIFLITKGLRHPSSLTIDYSEFRLYWKDTQVSISCSD